LEVDLLFDSAGRPDCSTLPPAVLKEILPEWLPTAAGLYDMTAELWSQESFQALPEVQGLGLPTIEDCGAALRDEALQANLEAVCEWNLTIADIEGVPTARRTKQTEALLAQMRRTRDARAARLMEALDRVGPYKNWALVWRLFSEWEAEGN